MATTQTIKLVVEGENKASGIFDDINKKLDEMTKKMQPAISASQKVGIALLGIGAGVVAFGTLAVKSASDSEKVWAKVAQQIKLSGLEMETTSKAVQEMATEYQKLTGFSDEYVATIAGRLLPNLKDLKKVKEATMLALDLEKSGLMSAESATKTLSLAYEGEIMALKRLLPDLKTVSQETLNEMTASQRAEYAIKLLKEQVGGVAEAMGGTFAGQLARAKEALGDVMEIIGMKLLPVLTVFATKVAEFAENTLPIWIERTKEIIKWAQEHQAILIILAGAIMGALVPALIAGAVALYGLISAFVAGAIALAPFMIGGAVIAGLILGILWLIKNWELVEAKARAIFGAIVNFLTETWARITGAIFTAWEAIKNFFIYIFLLLGEIFRGGFYFMLGVLDAVLALMGINLKNTLRSFSIWVDEAMKVLGEFFKSHGETISSIWRLVWEIIFEETEKIINKITGVISAMFEWIAGAITTAGKPILDAWNAVWDAVFGKVASVFDRIKNVISTSVGWISDQVSKITGGIGKITARGEAVFGVGGGATGLASAGGTIPGFANGGIVNRPTLAMIGEAGAEAVVPLRRAGAGGFGGITINFSGNSFVGREGIAEKIGNDLMKILKRNVQL